MAGGRRHHLRVGADALPAAQHGLHLVAGGLRHGVPVLRHGPGRPDPQSVDRRDPRAGARRPRRRCATSGGGRLSNIVFMGMGEPLANYNRVLAAVRRIIAAPPHGFGISARSVTVSTVGSGARDPKARRRATRRHAGAVAARARRRAARHAGAGQQPLERRRSAGRRTVLRRRDRSAGVDRVRADPRRQRPAVAGDLLGKRLHGALGPLVHVNVIPLNPTPGSEWDASPKPAEREFVRRVRAQRGVLHGAGHPWSRDRRRLRSARRRGLIGLPEPAAPAAPPVTHGEEQHQGREADQVQIFDAADVVAVQHQQQKSRGAQSDDVPGAVVDPAPAPGRRRHVGDVDSFAVALHLGTGHGDSSGRNKQRFVILAYDELRRRGTIRRHNK